ncbi:hypothetical protein F383_18529 [Gossypium arboreum]|uniref:Uncharacterized protein n=1 Tax=Gossypium arboreum TaxID=29729 RepID=A0A0B0NLM5_GOSAR|nr:hypothetical protein F383_18529 [Gossypium arboreum]
MIPLCDVRVRPCFRRWHRYVTPIYACE